MGTEDAAAKLANVGDDKGGAEVCPCDKVCGFGVVDHPRGSVLERHAKTIDRHDKSRPDIMSPWGHIKHTKKALTGTAW